MFSDWNFRLLCMNKWQIFMCAHWPLCSKITWPLKCKKIKDPVNLKLMKCKRLFTDKYIKWGSTLYWQLVLVLEVWFRWLFSLVLVVGVLKPLAAQQIEPRLRCLLFLPAIFSEVVGEEEEKEEEGSRLHIFQPLLSAPTSRAQHSDKERGSVIWLHTHTNTLHWYFSFPYGNDHACAIHFHTIQT